MGWLMGVDLVERVEFFRLDANRSLQKSRNADWGQFLTPAPIARTLASLVRDGQKAVRILDAGAGVGSLFSAAVAELCGRKERPKSIHVCAYEIDSKLAAYLQDTMSLCEAACGSAGIKFSSAVVTGDFLAEVADRGGLFDPASEPFTLAILNPPYKKINAQSEARRLLSRIGVETSNLYTGFMAVAVKLLASGGELVAITPRSFCNGSYFRTFRRQFLSEMQLRTLHVFESRQQAFKEDEVLQENVILHAVKGTGPRGKVAIVSSAGPGDELPLCREVEYAEVVRPDDPQAFIHIVADEVNGKVSGALAGFTATLADLGITVSTGRVVDFRATEYLREKAEKNTAPLIWPTHFSGGYIDWPRVGTKKPEHILKTVPNQLVPNEPYVLVRRFSAKEEKRRVVAAVFDPERVRGAVVGFENHLNYFHQNGGGIDMALARGLAVFLNSTLVDSYFRQFNGHTQVNATDLRSLRYPSADQLQRIGEAVGSVFPAQAEVDALLARELDMPEEAGIDPVKVKEKTDQALAILKALGFPRQQLNERSALTLLALLGLKPDTAWAAASEPLCGITPMMDFFKDHYGKTYAPNTRETVRRQTVHQFLEAGLIVANPDKPERPVNSPKAVYQIETSALKLLRAFGTKTWEKDLATYLSSVATLKTRYAKEREMARIPVTLAPGREITLSPGGQNILVKQIIDEFVPRFTTPGNLIYVGDTDEKFAYFDKAGLASLGVEMDEHGKMPDVIVHYTEKSWLVLIEAVTSHGPVDGKRQDELKRLFAGSKAGLVYVTAFLTRKAMVSYLDQIAWETEVWVADAPTHLIHFNGKRFLGPY
jgi:adenine-specific DNA-methyltransferase